jgi:exodeoxyribonuclease-3
VLSLLTLNIQAAALPRARALLHWLASRPEQVFILTETSAGEGSSYLLDQCRRAGFDVIHSPDGADRGVALVGRVPLTARPDLVTGVTLPGRVAAATIAGQTELVLLGVYVPSSDRAPDKVTRKRTFISSLLAAVDDLPAATRAALILGGDYNVITRDHQPPYRGFLPFEYEMLDRLEGHGLVDAHRRCSPDVQAHSWIGRSGNGYRFDYFHVGAALADRITACTYLHEPREHRLTDHAAASLTLDVPTVAALPADPAGLTGAGALF